MKNAFGLGALIAVLSLTQSYVAPDSKQVKKEEQKMSREGKMEKLTHRESEKIKDAVE